MARVADRRWWVLAALAVSTVIIGLDVTVLNLALPMHAVKLNASSGDLQRFVDAHTLVFAAAIMSAGLLDDRFGRPAPGASPGPTFPESSCPAQG